MEQGTSSSQGFSGTVNLQLTDLIQMVCLSRSDLTVCVKSGKGKGTIYVRDGEIYHAQTESLVGEPAFFEIFRWKDGQFEMLPFRDLGKRSIDTSWEYLLLEAMRQRDEEEAGALENAEGEGEEVDALSSALDEDIDLVFERYDTSDRPAEEEGEMVQPPRSSFDDLKPSHVIKVLIVDDSTFFAKQLRRMLEADPFIQVIASARNGQEAVEFLAANPTVDLITLDAQMPVMPGDSTLKHIMVRFGIPVVIISSFHTTSLNDVFEFLQLGAVDFVTKPDSKEDPIAYGSNLCGVVKRASRAKVTHFRRLRKLRPDSSSVKLPPVGEAGKVLLILGAEGAYMDWFRLPLHRLCQAGLVIGIQKIGDRLLPGFCKLLQEYTKSPTRPLLYSEWISPGTFHFGCGSSQVDLKLIPQDLALGIEILPSGPLSWSDGVRSWATQLASQIGPRMSIYFLSSAHSFPDPFYEHLLQCGVSMVLPPLDTTMCTDLADSIASFSMSRAAQVVWAGPNHLMEVWLKHGPYQ